MTRGVICDDDEEYECDEDRLNELLDLVADFGGDGEEDDDGMIPDDDQPASSRAVAVDVTPEQATRFILQWAKTVVMNSAAATCLLALGLGDKCSEDDVQELRAGDVSMCSVPVGNGDDEEVVNDGAASLQTQADVIFIHWDSPSERLGRNCRLVPALN
jgi:hypothetical protein